MKLELDCIPCFARQVLQAARMCTEDKNIQKEILLESIKSVQEIDRYKSAPELGRVMHSTVVKFTGVSDPYSEIKRKNIRLGLKYYPFLKSFLAERKDKLYWALKIAAVGNILDSAVYGDRDMEDCLETELQKEFKICDIDLLREDLQQASSLLLIGDNAGETVFDKVLLEYLKEIKPQMKMYFAARGGPVINDATVEDAYASGLNETAEIISSGCTAPGLLLQEAIKEFMRIYRNTDIIISKGQGNYETLGNEPRKIYFILKAKCSVNAGNLGVPLNEYVLWCNKRIKTCN